MPQFNSFNRLPLKLSRAACASVQTERSLKLWRVLVEDAWYQEKLDYCARRAVRRANCPLDWMDDVKQDAMLLLARQLSRSLDAPKLESKLVSSGWLLAAIRGHCQEALRRISAAHRRCRQLYDEEDFLERSKSLASIFDLRGAIECLDEKERTVLQRWANGDGLKKIAQDQGLPYSQVWRIYRSAIEQLRARLSPRSEKPD